MKNGDVIVYGYESNKPIIEGHANSIWYTGDDKYERFFTMRCTTPLPHLEKSIKFRGIMMIAGEKYYFKCSWMLTLTQKEFDGYRITFYIINE